MRTVGAGYTVSVGGMHADQVRSPCIARTASEANESCVAAGHCAKEVTRERIANDHPHGVRKRINAPDAQSELAVHIKRCERLDPKEAGALSCLGEKASAREFRQSIANDGHAQQEACGFTIEDRNGRNEAEGQHCE